MMTKATVFLQLIPDLTSQLSLAKGAGKMMPEAQNNQVHHKDLQPRYLYEGKVFSVNNTWVIGEICLESKESRYHSYVLLPFHISRKWKSCRFLLSASDFKVRRCNWVFCSWLIMYMKKALASHHLLQHLTRCKEQAFWWSVTICCQVFHLHNTKKEPINKL